MGSFLNLVQTVEKHEEVHILTVEDHQEEKQRAMRQKRVPDHIGCIENVCLGKEIPVYSSESREFAPP